MSELKYKEVTQKIIGAAMRVHSGSGNGFQEVIYQRALEIELTKSGLLYKRLENLKYIPNPVSIKSL